MAETIKKMARDISFTFTEGQAETVCKHFGVNMEDLQDWEICELLDKVIDNLE